MRKIRRAGYFCLGRRLLFWPLPPLLFVFLAQGRGLADPDGEKAPPLQPQGTDYETLRKIKFLPELSGKKLDEKAQIIQKFLKKNFFDPSGLSYSLLLITGPHQVRPMNLQDMQGINVGDWTDWYGKEALELMKKGECMTFENSLTSAGLYLQAQVFRYKVTKSPEALAEAQRAFHAIDLVYEMGCRRGKRGWFAKPYGKRSTDTSSPDQLFFVLSGLYEYSSVADPKTNDRIAKIYKDAADFLIAQQYQVWNITKPPENSTVRVSYCNSIFMLAHTLAYHVSRDNKYAKELDRIGTLGKWREATSLDDWRAGGGKGRKVVIEAEASGYIQVTAGEIMYRLKPDLFGATPSEAAEKWSDIVTKWWEYSKLGVDQEFFQHYWIDLNLDDGTWRPTGLTPLKNPLVNGSVFESYNSDVRWSDLLYRQAYSSLLVALYGKTKSQEGLRYAKEILTLTDGDRIRWFIDPDGKQLRPDCKWMECQISSESPFHYLNVYFRGRASNLW